MKMKISKLFAITLCVAMTLSLIACGGTQKPASSPPATSTPSQSASSGNNEGTYLDQLSKPAAKNALCIGSGSSSGVWYIVGGGIANAINQNSDWFTVTSEAASGGGENLRNLQEGNIEIAMLNCDMGYYFYTSTGSYEGAGSDQLRALFSMPASTMHLVVRAGSGIQSIEDLKGKSVAVGTAGSGYELFASKLVECAGLTYDDMKIQMINPSQMPDVMKDGQIDAFFFPVQVPGSAITELALSFNLEILSFSPEFIEKFLSEYVGYVRYTIPAGTYSGQNADIETVATGQFSATLIDTLTEDEVYVLMRDIFDNREGWVTSHSSCVEMTETNLDSIIIPLHAGAVKFYEERGVEIPENLIPPESK